MYNPVMPAWLLGSAGSHGHRVGTGLGLCLKVDVAVRCNLVLPVRH